MFHWAGGVLGHRSRWAPEETILFISQQPYSSWTCNSTPKGIVTPEGLNPCSPFHKFKQCTCHSSASKQTSIPDGSLIIHQIIKQLFFVDSFTCPKPLADAHGIHQSSNWCALHWWRHWSCRRARSKTGCTRSLWGTSRFPETACAHRSGPVQKFYRDLTKNLQDSKRRKSRRLRSARKQW